MYVTRAPRPPRGRCSLSCGTASLRDRDHWNRCPTRRRTRPRTTSSGSCFPTANQSLVRCPLNTTLVAMAACMPGGPRLRPDPQCKTYHPLFVVFVGLQPPPSTWLLRLRRAALVAPMLYCGGVKGPPPGDGCNVVTAWLCASGCQLVSACFGSGSCALCLWGASLM